MGGRAPPQLPVSPTLNLARPFQAAQAPGCQRLNPELKMAESLTHHHDAEQEGLVAHWWAYQDDLLGEYIQGISGIEDDCADKALSKPL